MAPISQLTLGQRKKMGHFGGLKHLGARFLFSVVKSKDEEVTKSELLKIMTKDERDLFFQQKKVDQTHSLRSAKSIYAQNGDQVHTDLVIAAALHDVGKLESELGIVGRIAATCLAFIFGLGRVHSWGSKREGTLLNRVSKYVTHPEIGAQMLEEAKSCQLAISWALDHHKQEKDSTIDKNLFVVLQKADRA